MLRRSPRAVLLWSAALLVAVVTALWVAGALRTLDRQTREFGAVRTVVVAARDLTVGHTVTAKDLRTRRVRGHDREAGSLDAPGDAVGRVVTVPVLRDAVVTTRHLTSRDRDGRDGVVPRGLRAMRVAVDGAVQPRPGDAVDVYVTFAADAVPADVDPTLTVAAGVPVIAVDDGEGGSSEAASGSPSGDRGPTVGVTVLVTEPQARRLAFAIATGTLALAILPPEDAAAAGPHA